MILTADEFIRLRKSSIPEEYMRAGLDSAPLEVWLEVIKKHPDMRVWVARNRTIRGEVQAILAQDNDPEVRAAIASKYPLDTDLYQTLAVDGDEGVRRRIIYNKKTPLDILKRIAEEDSDDFVRKNAAKKYNERQIAD